MDGSRGVVTSAGNILQENGVKWGAYEGGNGVWDSGTGSLDGDIVVLFEIDAGVLFRRIVWVAKKFLLQTDVTRAHDVNTVLPGAEAKRCVASSTTRLLLRGVPTASRVGSIRTPPAATSVGCDMATARTSVVDRRSSKGVVATKGGCRRAGVVPAVPRKGKVSMMETRWDTIVLTQLWEERV